MIKDQVKWVVIVLVILIGCRKNVVAADSINIKMNLC